MHHVSRTGPSARRHRHVLCFLIPALTLAACGGDSSRRHSERQLNETSAPLALRAVTHSLFASPKIITYMPALIQQVSEEQCSTGSVTITPEDSSPVTDIAYAECLEDFGGISTLTDGTLHFGYSDDDTLIQVVAENFLEHSLFLDIEDRLVTFDGQLDFPAGPASPVSYTANGTYHLVHTAPDTDDDVLIRFQDFQMTSTLSGTDLIQYPGGSLLLDNGAVITLTTGDNGLTRPEDAICPSSGTLTVTASDGSHLDVLFSGEDHIVVTVNGVAQPEQSCDEYLALIAY
ncbi:hypothetical protein A167_03325 [Alcanivorax sp. S71-1-4]|jgi:hypothetical protein|uniref:hypothetical protein n=1 Tax=Alcanivorax sp. S71-1-4 TaxID=1177159 RepID=UPI001357D008|nr:hypothetical protein [Alcanivorax sp. S71-1-4]KAF0805982.1 hypothetical protein A167_03325 [Alcanivorax sp. S71-1-4]